MLKKPKVGVYLFNNDFKIDIKELKKLIKFLENDYVVTLITEVKLPSSVPHYYTEKALENTYYFPFDIRIIFSSLEDQQTKDLTSENLFFSKLDSEVMEDIKNQVDDYFFNISKSLLKFNLDKTLCICNFSESYSVDILGDSQALNSLKQHSRVLLVDGSVKRLGCSADFLKVTDIIVLHNLINVSVFDLDKPVVLNLSSLKPLEDLELSLRRDLLQSGIIQLVVTRDRKVKDLMDMHSIDVLFMEYVDPEILLKSYIKLYKKFNPKVKPVLVADHSLTDKQGNRITIPSDICKSFDSYDLHTEDFVEFRKEYEEFQDFRDQEKLWQCWKIYQSCKLLSNFNILYIGDNVELVSYLSSKGYDIVVLYTGVLKSPFDKRKRNYKNLKVCKDLFSLKNFNRNDRLVVCDSIVDGYNHLDTLGFINFIKNSGYTKIALTFERKNNLFINVNSISPYLSELGFRLNGNGFKEKEKSAINSFIYLIYD